MKISRWMAALVAVLLLLPLMSVAEASGAADLGSITVEMVYDKREVKGGVLSAYYVGSIAGNKFVKTQDFAAFPGNYDNVTDPALAGALAEYVDANKIPAVAEVENQDGEVKFTGLELGLYLIVQTKESVGFDPISPFLVTVPLDGKVDVNAAGKFQLHQETTQPTKPTNPTKPTGPKLPQTGQLNWPIPVMVAVGLLLFAAGWALRFGKRKEKQEK